MKIGFVGLGAMGTEMAGRLLEAGHELAVYNRTQSKADALVEKGARRAETPADAAQGAEVVFSMLFDDHAVENATFGENGIADGLADGAVHVGCATISVDLSRRLKEAHAERGQAYISATVLGRPPAARDGKLFVITAGSDDVLARVSPLLDALGQKTFRVGDDPTQANLVKLCLNALIFSTIEQMAEVFTLGEKAGIAHGTMFEVLTNSFYTAPVHKNYGQIMVDKSYDPPGAAMQIGAKDNGLFLKAGEELEVPLPLASLMRDRFIAAFAAGDGEKDFAALLERVRQDAGLK